MSHLYHPEATTQGVLSEQCGDCLSKLLCNLDSGHTMSSGGFYEAHLTNLPAHLRGHLMRTSAIALQREWIDRLMHEQPNLGKAKHAAAAAPIRDKAGRIVRDHKAKDMGDGAALLAARGETP